LSNRSCFYLSILSYFIYLGVFIVYIWEVLTWGTISSNMSCLMEGPMILPPAFEEIGTKSSSSYISWYIYIYMFTWKKKTCNQRDVLKMIHCVLPLYLDHDPLPSMGFLLSRCRKFPARPSRGVSNPPWSSHQLTLVS
jgi:hypothetical protein